MRFSTAMVAALMLLLASGAAAATFIVPTDEEMANKSNAIVVGTVEGSFTQYASEMIETVYEIRVSRAIKGPLKGDDLVRIATLGGVIGDRGVLVPGEARFEQGEKVLLFLTQHAGRWRTTDLTLGRFEFVTSTKGERLLVRAMEDVVGWDHAGRVYRERVRKQDEFLDFLTRRASGERAPATNYLVDISQVTLAPEPADSRFTVAANATAFPAATYTDFVSNQPIRWPNMSAGVRVYKRSDQNISGAADGGVSVIQGALNAWNNEPGSAINLIYNGQIATASQNHDGTNVVEFNDPQSRITGSWTGSGTVGIAFLSFAGTHTFLGQSWLNITDADVVFQNGYPATNASFSSAMTHEVGHGIGWRHSNQDYATGGACNSAVEECTSAAIMNSTVSANYGFALQPWDINAAQSVYPESTTACTAPTISGQPASRTITAGSSTTLSVTAGGTTPFTYQWYVGSSGNTSSPVGGGTGASLTVSPATTSSYWVSVRNGCGEVWSLAATVTVTSAPPPSAGVRGDINGDGRADILWRNYSTGANMVWTMNGATRIGSASLQAVNDVSWRLAAAADFNRDGHTDLVWQHTTSGQIHIWLMNRTVIASSVFVGTQSDLNWSLLAAGDLTKDGNPDLIWRNRATGANSLWVMNGTTRSSISALQTVADTRWVLEGAADMNGDGMTDLVWRHATTGTNNVWHMNGSVIASSVTLQPVSDTNWRIEGVADYDGDGDGDLVWRNYASGANVVWLMNGTTPQSAPSLPSLAANQGWELSGPR